jgi:hypothetical protein
MNFAYPRIPRFSRKKAAQAVVAGSMPGASDIKGTGISVTEAAVDIPCPASFIAV